MDALYNLFKFLHVAAVIVWLGGQVAVGLLNARVARSRDPAAMGPLAQASRFFGGAIVGPAALVTLLAGMAMTGAGGIPITDLWILWGFAGILVSGVLGGTVIRRIGERLGTLARSDDAAERQAVPALQARMRNLQWLNLAVLFSTVAAMVFKPTL